MRKRITFERVCSFIRAVDIAYELSQESPKEPFLKTHNSWLEARSSLIQLLYEGIPAPSRPLLNGRISPQARDLYRQLKRMFYPAPKKVELASSK